MKLEYIEWEDVLSSGSEWMDENEVSEWKKDAEKSFVIKQCGFVIEETERYLLMCSHHHEGTGIAPQQHGHLCKILKSLILKRVEIDYK